ncbi:Oidioi.mRNA.OKI2018_I69.PAR.g12154.t1.cds [Oikopleura dioica]|uniref:Oidioi.mRNA.OKI2018_I69.PAR.g12154.t1.cds n=1 Tax=Oikopleura dioica TaxID=34765 RepID=A0ABN7S3N0_OIKDI|nr:Oidioi.mRNA.OKI2018_I69.PAR.g12154.t1.cds [Oikopleura dioica]
MKFLKLLLLSFSFSRAAEFLVEIDGQADVNNFRAAVLQRYQLSVVGFSFCPLARRSIERLREVDATFAIFYLDTQADHWRRWWYIIRVLSGNTRPINIFINQEATFTDELATDAITDEELRQAIQADLK